MVVFESLAIWGTIKACCAYIAPYVLTILGVSVSFSILLWRIGSGFEYIKTIAGWSQFKVFPKYDKLLWVYLVDKLRIATNEALKNSVAVR